MGCDIHIQIEAYGEHGWEIVPWVTEPEDSDEWVDWDRYHATALKLPPSFEHRNYDRFALLDDIRNGSSGHLWPSLAPHRGIPDDSVTHDRYLGEHSFTWVTLDEVERHPWGDIVGLLESASDVMRPWLEECLPKIRAVTGTRKVRLILGFDS